MVTDLISPTRRGLVMSFWGLSQGVGTLAGTLVGGLLGATDWRRPFLLLTGVWSDYTTIWAIVIAAVAAIRTTATSRRSSEIAAST